MKAGAMKKTKIAKAAKKSAGKTVSPGSEKRSERSSDRRSDRNSDRRVDGRTADKPRPVKITRGVLKHAEGSALIQVGGTQVLCAVTIEDRLPPWMRASGQKGRGWITAEYGMLPRSVPERAQRGRVSGRSFEIQRLIGRSLRAVIDLTALGEKLLTIDCDVLEADGGTRVASVTGAWVALDEAIERLMAEGRLPRTPDPRRARVAAVSVGLVEGRAALDLDYHEDFAAEVDMNIVMTGGGRYVEIQGTGEEATFSDRELSSLLSLARGGIEQLAALQKQALGKHWPFG
jgi:ribonuclease PH